MFKPVSPESHATALRADRDVIDAVQVPVERFLGSNDDVVRRLFVP